MGRDRAQDEYSWATYKWGTEDNFTKYNDSDGKIILDPEDDDATANLGSPWHMPTEKETDELGDNCTWTLTTQDGVKGCEVKGPNGNSIFLSAAGCRKDSELEAASSWCYYRVNAPYTVGSDLNGLIAFGSNGSGWFGGYRYAGYLVRPVRP